jgi:hypothetical protein
MVDTGIRGELCFGSKGIVILTVEGWKGQPVEEGYEASSDARHTALRL